MKKIRKIILWLIAVIGILAVVVFVARAVGNRSEVDLLRASGPFVDDPAAENIKIVRDSVRAKEIRDYFQLDTLYTSDMDTWTKALAIGRFVAANIPHENQRERPEHANAIGLWEYTKHVAPAFNCRYHSIFTFELMLAAGLDARFVTCMPKSKRDNDCHVVNEVWLPELGKWAMIDTDMGGRYVSDPDGTPLSLLEMRERYISGETMKIYPAFENGSTEKDWYYSYMAKNTYWFSCWKVLSFYVEDYSVEGVNRDVYYNLVPSGFEPFRPWDESVTITDAGKFWSAPGSLD